jgi:hypothetical protein
MQRPDVCSQKEAEVEELATAPAKQGGNIEEAADGTGEDPRAAEAASSVPFEDCSRPDVARASKRLEKSRKRSKGIQTSKPVLVTAGKLR